MIALKINNKFCFHQPKINYFVIIENISRQLHIHDLKIQFLQRFIEHHTKEQRYTEY